MISNIIYLDFADFADLVDFADFADLVDLVDFADLSDLFFSACFLFWFIDNLIPANNIADINGVKLKPPDIVLDLVFVFLFTFFSFLVLFTFFALLDFDFVFICGLTIAETILFYYNYNKKNL